MRADDDDCTRKSGRKTLLLAILALLIAVFLFAFCACDDIEDQIPDESYAITFVLNNGEADVVWMADSEECPLNFVDGVPTPKYDGKVFGGWFCDEALSTPFEFDFENIFLVDDFTIYAKWIEPNNFEGIVFEDSVVTYDGRPHSIVVSNLPDGATVTYLDELEHINVGEYEISAVVKKEGYNDLSLCATLTINKAKIDSVTFENKTVEWDGEEHSIFVSGLPSGVEVAYTNNAQTDVGVYEVRASFDVGTNYLPLDEMVATLTISQKICKVTFVVGDKEFVVDAPYGSTIVNRPEIDIKDGYSASWNFDDSTIIEDDMTITAVYVPIVYNIEFELCGGQGDFESISYTIEDEDIVLSAPTRDRYDFCGWYDNASYLGNSFERIAKGSFGNIKLYAKWTPVEYEIEYILYIDGATNDMNNPLHYTVESEIIQLNKANAVGYVFCGWFCDEDFTEKVESIDPQNYDGKITLYALWRGEEYNITYILDGGVNAAQNPQTYIYGEECPLYEATRENYDFLGWFDNEGREVSNLLRRRGDITLTAKWAQTVYQVHYDLAGGDNDFRNKLSFTVEDENFALYPPSRAHYNFVAWQENGENVESVDASRGCDLYLTAVWTDIWYDIQYVAEGATYENEVTNKYTFFMSVELPTPKMPNCEFLGWYDNASFEGEKIDRIAEGSEGNKTFYAKFSQNVVQFEYELRTKNEYGEDIEPYFAITKYIGESLIVSVPSTIDGNSIKKISASTFSGLNLTEITIEEGIAQLEEGAFFGLNTLKTLRLPSTISYIPNGMLKDCSQLEELVLPFVGDRIYKRGDINKNLYGFSRLFATSAGAQDGFASIPNYSIFADELGSVRVEEDGTYSLIPSTLAKVVILGGDIFKNAFAYCNNIQLLEVYGGEFVADFAMRECTSLKTLVVGDTFADISTCALYSCQKLESIMVGSEEQRVFFENLKGNGKICANVVISINMYTSKYVEEVAV